MDDTEYNLLDEQWILALDGKGDVSAFSLKSIFGHAHELEQLSGEIPTQDLAVMRLLIAVLYSVYQDRDEDGNSGTIDTYDEALRRWKALWDRGRFDTDMISKYLESYRDRFFLFHPTRPFYQAPISKGTSYRAPKLNGEISVSNNKPRLFVPVSGRDYDYMGYAEAARWLLNLNGYDDTSSKKTVRDEKMPSSGAGWIGKLGPIYIKGSNLFETLMLNMVLVSDDYTPYPVGNPTWASEKANTAERVIMPLPKSPVELFTLQSRRILLEREGDYVSGYLLMGGDIVQKENAFTETMTLWRQTKDGDFVPKRLNPAKSMWQDYRSILLRASDDRKSRRPGVVRWAELLDDEGLIAPNTFTIATAGVVYGDKDFFIQNFTDDSITVNGAMLSNLNEKWNVRVSDVISITDSCVHDLGHFSSDISKILTGNPDSGKEKAEQICALAYYRMDRPFRDWLRSLNPSKDDIEVRMGEWVSIEADILKNMAKQMLDESCEKAITGRGDDTVFIAYRKFLGSLNKHSGRGSSE